MTALSSIKWGFLGCGKVVEQKSGSAFSQISGSSVHAVMRRSLSAARDCALKFSAPCWFDRVDDLLASDVDAVYIATPPGLHYEQAMQCCAAGKPIYIEKPLARNYTEAKAIVNAFVQKNLPVYAGHYRRALPRFLKIRRLLAQERIGRPCAVNFYLNRIFSRREAQQTWLYNPALSGGGKFYDIAPHTVDIIHYLFGTIREINGYAVNSGTECPLEDHVVFSFRTDTDIIGCAAFNCISDRKDDRMIVTGTKGTLEFSIHGRHDIIIHEYRTGETEVLEIPDPKIVEGPMIEAVIRHLLGHGGEPCMGQDALPTYQVIDSILTGFYHGRENGFWNHPQRWG